MPETYDDLLAVGDRFCEYVVDRLRAEGVAISFIRGLRNQLKYGDTDIGIEIKFDRILHSTGNLYIEVDERRDPAGTYVRGGIYRRDRTRWYGIGDYSRWFVYAKAALIAEHVRRGRPAKEIPAGTSRGFLIRPTDVPVVVRKTGSPAAWSWPSRAWDGTVRELLAEEIRWG